jgi:peptidoglycan/LPS O-acetylase OafA/YrhL
MTSVKIPKYESTPNPTIKKENSTLGYLTQLDGLRVLAVAMVMVGHWEQWKWTHPLLTSLPFNHGVTLFFVLSGFLITRILIYENQVRQQTEQPPMRLLWRFYLRRTLRIFPLYYSFVFLLVIINHPMARELSPWLFTYTTNIYQSIHNVYVGDFNHFWSLGVEEQFYLFWPLIFFVFPRSKSLLIGMIALAVLGIGVRIYLAIEVEKWMATSYFTLACMPVLALGGILAWIKQYSNAFFVKLNHPAFLTTTLILYAFGLYAKHTFGLIWYKEIIDEYFFAILAFFMIAKASAHGFSGWIGFVLKQRWIQYTGQISYGLYVFHLFAPPFCSWILQKVGINLPGWSMLLLYTLTTYLLAHASWVLMERPINRWKQNLPYLIK